MNPLKNILRWIKREEKKDPVVVEPSHPTPLKSFLSSKGINILHNKNVRADKVKKKNRVRNKIARKSRRVNELNK